MPDIYQGDELPLFALVDPDNRRPVDWEWNEAMLGRLAGGAQPEPAIRKLWLTTRLLGLRIRRPGAFAGAYEPVDAPDTAVAFLRGDEVLVAVATRPGRPRARSRAPPGAGATCSTATSACSAPRVALAELLDEYGIAVLERA